jgi:putative FmdB family regulatory protein
LIKHLQHFNNFYGKMHDEIVLFSKGGTMPIYTYQCGNCGVQFERQQKFSDPALKKCPECGKNALHKVYTPVGIVFKGSGFYAQIIAHLREQTQHRTQKVKIKTPRKQAVKQAQRTPRQNPLNFH